jgi:hypothetical protein
VAVTLSACAQPFSHQQIWLPGTNHNLDRTNITLATGAAPPPHCFGGYNRSTCYLLTVLAWELPTEKTVMLWVATADVAKHPQHWSYGARFRQVFTLEDAIRFRTCSREALACVRPMAFLSGVHASLPVCTVNSI